MSYAKGDRVNVNGFEGVITEVCDGILIGMFVVRLNRGTVCVSGRDLNLENPGRKS